MKESQQLCFVPKAEGSSFGTLCVKYWYFCDSTPEKKVLYWPVGECFRHEAEAVYPELAGGAEPDVRDCGNGVYDLYRGYGNHARAIRLKDGGRTQAIRIDTIPIPAPRSKLPIRWERGGWQRELKTGWAYF